MKRRHEKKRYKQYTSSWKQKKEKTQYRRQDNSQDNGQETRQETRQESKICGQYKGAGRLYPPDLFLNYVKS